ncbi:MAG: phosphate acetyltransferase [Clostridia bacterium]
MPSLIEVFKQKAKVLNKTIVLPEGEEIRIIKAAEMIMGEGFAKVILLGDENKIKQIAPNANLTGVEIINPLTSDKRNEYADMLYQLRKAKGMTEEEAYKLAGDVMYYGVMMVKTGVVDGMVGGAIHSTGDLLRPALQIIKTKPGISTVSGYFIMELQDKTFGDEGLMLFADCAVNPNPTAEQLADIAVASVDSAKTFFKDEPRVAMLSFSTMGSAKSELVDKVKAATDMAKAKAPEMNIDGELQVDAALIEKVGALKAPGSKVAGRANVLVFPDLNAGNIGYKLVQRLAHANAYGPICQGMAKPVNDLSRGCSSEDVCAVVAMTCMQCK